MSRRVMFDVGNVRDGIRFRMKVPTGAVSFSPLEVKYGHLSWERANDV